MGRLESVETTMSFVRGLLLLVMFGIPTLPGGAQSFTEGARALSLAGATTALPRNPWTSGNAASPATINAPLVSLHSEHPYGLSELWRASFSVVYPGKFGHMHAGASTFGFESYRENTFSLSFATNLFSNVFLGVKTALSAVSIPDYGSASAFGISLGGLAPVWPGLWAGVNFTNINNPAYVNGGQLERTASVGLSYHVQDRAVLLVDLRKAANYPVEFRSGLEIRPASLLSLRAGMATAPVRFTVGVGLETGNLLVDVGSQRHEWLGWSPSASLGITW